MAKGIRGSQKMTRVGRWFYAVAVEWGLAANPAKILEAAMAYPSTGAAAFLHTNYKGILNLADRAHIYLKYQEGEKAAVFNSGVARMVRKDPAVLASFMTEIHLSQDETLKARIQGSSALADLRDAIIKTYFGSKEIYQTWIGGRGSRAESESASSIQRAPVQVFNASLSPAVIPVAPPPPKAPMPPPPPPALSAAPAASALPKAQVGRQGLFNVINGGNFKLRSVTRSAPGTLESSASKTAGMEGTASPAKANGSSQVVRPPAGMGGIAAQAVARRRASGGVQSGSIEEALAARKKEAEATRRDLDRQRFQQMTQPKGAGSTGSSRQGLQRRPK